jgi:hypothetical protein
LSAWFLFSGDLNTNVDFSDLIFVKIYNKGVSMIRVDFGPISETV